MIEVEGDASRWAAVLREAGAAAARIEDARLIVQTAPAAKVPDLVAALVAAGARVRQVVQHEPSLEDAYLDLVRHDA